MNRVLQKRHLVCRYLMLLLKKVQNYWTTGLSVARPHMLSVRMLLSRDMLVTQTTL
jgi:hypothetical protein